MIEVLLFCLIFLIAYSNGANDISRGIATLVGRGATNTRWVTLWGVLTAALGGVLAIALGSVLLKVFSNAVLTGPVDHGRIAAALAGGAAVWVLVSSRLGLPVSTTQAIIGGIVGAGLAEIGGSRLNWNSLLNTALLPLLASPIVSLSYPLPPSLSRMLAQSTSTRCCVYKQHRFGNWRTGPVEDRPRHSFRMGCDIAWGGDRGIYRSKGFVTISYQGDSAL